MGTNYKKFENVTFQKKWKFNLTQKTQIIAITLPSEIFSKSGELIHGQNSSLLLLLLLSFINLLAYSLT